MENAIFILLKICTSVKYKIAKISMLVFNYLIKMKDLKTFVGCTKKYLQNI